MSAMAEMMRWGEPHAFAWGCAWLWLFSAAVSAMAAPAATSGQWYRWLYRFTHLLAANLDRAGIFAAPGLSALAVDVHDATQKSKD